VLARFPLSHPGGNPTVKPSNHDNDGQAHASAAWLSGESLRPDRGKPGEISATMFAMAESLARTQGDKDFDFVFFHKHNKFETMPMMACGRTHIRPPGK